MPSARFPIDEAGRVATLRSYGILDAPRGVEFDDLTMVASQICDVPIALISLVDSERQWMLSHHGVELDETPRDVSFCAHAILGEGAMVVPDATRDPRFADNPLVLDGPKIRFYAGTPLVTESGHAIGTLCVIDNRPRTLSAAQVAALEALGRQVLGQIELRRSATRLRESEGRFRSIATAMRIGIFVVGPGDHVWSNPALTDLLGLEPGKLTRTTFHEPAWSILRHDESEYLRHEMPATRALRTGEPVHGAVMGIEGPATDGRVWVQVDAVPLFDDAGRPIQAICTLTDIGPLKRAKDHARQQSARLQSILTWSPLAIIATDTHGIIETFNAAAERLIGYSADELVGCKSPALFHLPTEVVARAAEFSLELGETIEPGFEVFVAKARRGLPNEHEWTYVRRDGSHVPVLLAVTEIHDAAGTLTGFLGIAADITARKHAEAALVSAKELAEQMAKAKTDFLATMSHEIRTPMNGVLGMTNLLADTVLTPEQRGYTDAIERSAQLLMGVINDILDFSKVEAGKLSIEPIPFDLEVAVTDVAELLVPRAAEKRIELVVAVDANLPKRLVGDAGRLRQILLNLAGNAVKFTETGHVAIEVQGVERGDAVMLRFEVTTATRCPGSSPRSRRRMRARRVALEGPVSVSPSPSGSWN
jgi:PAS domain S-box-containing protein